MRCSCPEYYELIREPVDFVSIKRNIDSGRYSSAAGFDTDCERCFTNVEVSNASKTRWLVVSHCWWCVRDGWLVVCQRWLAGGVSEVAGWWCVRGGWLVVHQRWLAGGV